MTVRRCSPRRPPASRRALALAALAGLVFAASSCSFTREPPVKRRFLLEAQRTTAAHEAPADGRTLEVRGFQGDAAFVGRSFVYRVGRTEIETDYYHEFLVPPGLALAESTRHWLGAAGLFARVQPAGSRVVPTHRLEGDILELSGQLDDDRVLATGRLELEFTLLDSTGAAAFARLYRSEQPTDGGTPAHLVDAWSAALADILTRLEGDLRALNR